MQLSRLCGDATDEPYTQNNTAALSRSFKGILLGRGQEWPLQLS